MQTEFYSTHRIATQNVNESLKMDIKRSAYYFSHTRSYYPVLDSGLSLEKMKTMPHVKPSRPSILTDKTP